MKRNHTILLGTLLGLLLPFSATVAEEEDATDLASAITSGKATISGRYRYENVDQDNALRDANASTLRLRLNYRTGQWNGWSAFGEFDYLFHVLLDDFNSGQGTSPNRSEYSVVTDPEGADLNQMYLQYSSNPNWRLRAGREKIILDNQRFVGPVGWRQNEQTFDGLTLNTTAVRNTTIFYSYVSQVQRIFGPTVSAGRNNVDAHLLNTRVTVSDAWTVTPYLYYIDNEDVAAFSTSTLGVRATGNVAVGAGKIALVGEFARQSEAGNGPVNYDVNYFNASALWGMKNGLSLGLGLESLGGSPDSGEMFRTPLATLHAFNGWADQFLTTPTGGLDDLYATVKYKAGKWNLTAVYHDFSSEFGSSDYGDEFDFSAGRKLGERYGLLFKGAFFSADSSSPLTNVDTNKFWIMLTASY